MVRRRWPLQIVTANRTHDGAVVYWTARGDWSTSLADGALAEGEAAERLLAAVSPETARAAIAPYLIAVERRDGRIVPTSLRERIRAQGPTAGPTAGLTAGSTGRAG